MANRKRIQFSTTLDPNLMDKLRELNENTNIPISKLLDKSIELLLEYYSDSLLYRDSKELRINPSKLVHHDSKQDTFDEILDSLVEEDITSYTSSKESKFGKYTISVDKIKEIQNALNIIIENEDVIFNTANEIQQSNKTK